MNQQRDLFRPAVRPDIEEESVSLTHSAVKLGLVADGPGEAGALEVDLGGVGPDSQRLDDRERFLQLSSRRSLVIGGQFGQMGPGELKSRQCLVAPGPESQSESDRLFGGGPGAGDVACTELGPGPGDQQQRRIDEPHATVTDDGEGLGHRVDRFAPLPPLGVADGDRLAQNNS